MGEKHPDAESLANGQPHSPPPTTDEGVVLSSGADAELLATMGYKQELKRNFSTLEIFGIAFASMGTLPSVASTLALSLPAGPAGMVWSWLAASCCIFCVGLAMADMGSAMPTAGGLYYWTHHFADERLRDYLSFLVGYSNTLGMIGGVCGVSYGFALMFCSVIVIGTDGAWTPSNGVVYVVFMATLLVHATLASTLSRLIGRLQMAAVVLNLALIVGTVVALPLGIRNGGGGGNDARVVFTEVKNLTGWPTGWSLILASMSPIWTAAGYDCCVGMSEEASNASRAVPLAIMLSVGLSGLLGFVIVTVIAACISDIEAVLRTPFGQPMAQIYYDALGKQGTLAFMAFLLVAQFFMGLAILVVASRQAWAFSRDGALPFSTFLRQVSKRFGYIPLRAIWAVILAALLMGLLCLIAPAAAAAIFSLGVAGQHVAFGVPIAARAVGGGGDKFRPGAFYTGRRLSRPIAAVAAAFCAFVVVLCMFPQAGPGPTPDGMNYTVVVGGSVWLGASLYFAVSARKWYRGPRATLRIVEGARAASE
ncbi:hypothetical protein RB595_001778 [Gaeumannomyces hyphopodioides]